jgi:hypothetical protein
VIETAWVHGHSGRLQATTGFAYERLGYFLRLKADGTGETWVHYSLPTQAPGRRVATTVLIQMRTWGGGQVGKVHLWDGSSGVVVTENPRDSSVGSQTRATEDGERLQTISVPVEPPLEIFRAIGVSLLLVANAPRDAIAIASVGVTLNITRRSAGNRT